MQYAGFSKDCQYINFENKITEGLSDIWRQEVDLEIKGSMRLEIQRKRCFARDIWIAMGYEVPDRIQFSDGV